ncbi:MAG TPA: hypothetical protein DF292_08070, partial [Firmicutes bacterium]|nr:hypothetical protein [Bacillota bacterium]
NHSEDLAHPAFSKLFVETTFLKEHGALIARRKPKSRDEKTIWAGHMIAGPGELMGYETNRERFLGRDRSVRNPQALEDDLANSSGYVLDPVFSLRTRVTIKPGERARF